MKVLSIVGTRPQYVKVATVSQELRSHHEEILVDTGQHYDFEMSEVFIQQLNIAKPDFDLGVGSGSHGEQTGRILIELEKVLQSVKPDLVMVYGDTNSTLAGALAAVKLGYSLAHVEAGERSYNRSMPEEINRVVADHTAHLLFCSTERSIRNLEMEGIRQGVHLVGDVICDSLLANLPKAESVSPILDKLGLETGTYSLLTLHRPVNVDDLSHLERLLTALSSLEERIVCPVHPRTQRSLRDLASEAPGNVTMIPPVGYLDMLVAEKNARCIITDSGGVQKEAYLLSVPCVTCREETEWTETVEAGWNTLVGSDPDRLRQAVAAPRPQLPRPPLFGDGHAAQRIVELLG